MSESTPPEQLPQPSSDERNRPSPEPPLPWQAIAISVLLATAISFFIATRFYPNPSSTPIHYPVFVFDIESALFHLRDHFSSIPPMEQIRLIEQVNEIALRMADESGAYVAKRDAFLAYPPEADISAIVAAEFLASLE